MGYRTLTWGLVWRALFLDDAAYEAMRDDDNPYIEGLLLVVLIGAGTALLNLIGQLIHWASVPSVAGIQAAVLQTLKTMDWWSSIANNPQAIAQFNYYWDLGWRFLPALFGAPSPARAAFDILLWPILAVLSWLIYGLLAFGFARLLHGAGTLNQTLGTTALAAAPLMLRGLGFIPFLTIGGVLSTWQLICRYKAIQRAHRLSWQRAMWATVLPFAVYLVFWLVVGGIGVAVSAAFTGR
jgi:hypothetical protein